MENELKAAQARIAELEDLNTGLEADVKRLREKNATFSAAWDELAALKAQDCAESDYYRSMLRAVLKDIRDEIPRGGLPQSWNDIADSISASLHRPLYAAPVVSAEQQGVAQLNKLLGYMASNVKEGWTEVERIGAVASYISHEAALEYLDGLEPCNVGLSERVAPAPSTTEGQCDE
jgi:hypothetical protein